MERALKLMAYADGELDGAEREEVEAWLAEDPDALRMASDVAHLGGYLKTGFEGSADAKAIASFDIADIVMAEAKGSEAKSGAKYVASVASITDARARREGGRGSYRVAGGVIAAMALAASVFMMARPHDEEPIARGRPHAPVVAAVEPTASSSSGTPDNGVGVDINVAETAEQSVSVVYLPSENSLTTSVVLWVDETGEQK
jgi:anti-sigma factor RsiW